MIAFISSTTKAITGNIFFNHAQSLNFQSHLARVDGAKKLGEVSATFSNKPYTYGVEVSEGNQPESRVSALVEDVDGLLVDGYWDDYDRSHAFGVL